jgi:hypothetical protein
MGKVYVCVACAWPPRVRVFAQTDDGLVTCADEINCIEGTEHDELALGRIIETLDATGVWSTTQCCAMLLQVEG